MRIALLCPEAFDAGGIGRHTWMLARALGQAGQEVEVFLPGQTAASSPGPGVVVTSVGSDAPWHIPGLGRTFGLTLAQQAWGWRARRAVLLRHRTQPFDVLESPEWMAGGAWLTQRHDLPLVVRAHGPTRLIRRQNGLPETLDSRWVARMEHATLARAHAITTPSRLVARALVADHVVPPWAIRLDPLGIEPEVPDPTPREVWCERLDLPPGACLVLHAGRLERRKGVMELVEAAAEAGGHLALVLAGADTGTAPDGGSMAAWIRRRSSRMAHPVRLTGWLEPSTLASLMAIADLVVVPSPAEPYGLVILEAMWAGKPVLACQDGGAADLLTHGREGWLVPPRSPSALGRALAVLAADADLRRKLGEAGQVRARKLHGASAMAERTLSLYRSVAPGATR
ncbi:MAG: glycosyltransferase family 4 protein [bacterium]|nr:glycosyltransferase family 4 protein [bacterium]